jgi:hypothetical protein
MTHYLKEPTKNKLFNAFISKGRDLWIASEFGFLSFEISSLKRKDYIEMKKHEGNNRYWSIARDGEIYLKKYVLSGRF